MKKLLLAFAIGAFALAGTATHAEARPYSGHGYRTPANTVYVSGYRYGRPIYTEKIFVGYDCHGRPRFIYRQLPAPVRYYTPPCPPTYTQYHDHRYGRSGGSITLTFRR